MKSLAVVMVLFACPAFASDGVALAQTPVFITGNSKAANDIRLPA